MRLLPIILGSVVWVGCGSPHANRDQVALWIDRAVGAKLPVDAIDVYGHVGSVFTTVVDARFRCTEEQLQEFLKSSPRFNGPLEANQRTVVNSMCAESWWQPDQLQSIRGLKRSWSTGRDDVDACLIVGDDSSPGIIVYLAVVLERRASNSVH